MLKSINNFFGGLAGCLLFLFLLGACLYKGSQYARLACFGQHGNARIVGMSSRKDPRKENSTSYTISYAGNTTTGHHFNGTSSVSKKVYNQYSGVDQVPVTYLPGDPRINCFGGAGQVWWDLTFFSALTAISGAMLVGCARFAVGKT